MSTGAGSSQLPPEPRRFRRRRWGLPLSATVKGSSSDPPVNSCGSGSPRRAPAPFLLRTSDHEAEVLRSPALAVRCARRRRTRRAARQGPARGAVLSPPGTFGSPPRGSLFEGKPHQSGPGGRELPAASWGNAAQMLLSGKDACFSPVCVFLKTLQGLRVFKCHHTAALVC